MENVMCSKDCQQLQVEKVRSWLSGDHRKCAVWLVGDYYTSFRGAGFDTLACSALEDMITDNDLEAVRALSIRFPRAFIGGLASDSFQQCIREALIQIPSDVALEDLSCAEFDRLLGPESAAWKAWEDLAASPQKRQGPSTAGRCQQAAGRQTTAPGAAGG
jgi:hypothetical protein